MTFYIKLVLYISEVTGGARDNYTRQAVLVSQHCGGTTEETCMEDMSYVTRPTSALAQEAYRENFPFLNWIDRQIPGVFFYIGVEQIDHELLELVPQDESAPPHPVMAKYVYLIDKKNAILGHDMVPATKRERIGKFSLFRPSSWYKPTLKGWSVKTALIELGDLIQDLAYIVVVTWPSGQAKVQIFKLPKRFNLTEWIAEEKRRLLGEINPEALEP